ncbi:hypothetical protein PHLCEN_2v2516 [Hermanssonia centrifuga]|uniref:Uncharacterized protein n=1 Tax=Hermanssonia centrifuga TaxID=98765 RepID=A0A2R6RLP1_9APHY|nr:hypothetical protein PHLCEN_2v2516 [Hermanssonia centrifuga]
MDADSVRRSSSRARRPAAKLRDRERDAGEEYVSAAITSQQVAASIPVTNGAKVPEVTPTSPRKRRGAGGGGRRKRRETDDGDGAYPNPPKRARNPRGGVIAVASPLAGPALAAATPQPQESLVETEDQGELDNASVAADVEDTRAQDQRRSTRSRKSRTAVPTSKRRSSSASETTATSVSVSIAVNARSTRSAAGKASEEATGSNSSDKILETTGGDTERRTSSLDPNETLPQAGEDVRMEIADEKPVVDGEAEGSQENDVASSVPQEESVEGPTEPVDTPGDANGQSAEPLADAVTTPVPEQIEAKAEEKSPVIPGSGSARVILGPVAVQNSKKATRDEEKEEGELSEEITPPPKSRQPSSAI